MIYEIAPNLLSSVPSLVEHDSIIFFNEVNEEFYFYIGMQQQKAPLILSIKPSQNLTHLVYLYFQLNYIF